MSHAEVEAPLGDICDELIVRMGADLSNAPRSRVAVLSHKVSNADICHCDQSLSAVPRHRLTVHRQADSVSARQKEDCDGRKAHVVSTSPPPLAEKGQSGETAAPAWLDTKRTL